MFVNFNCCPRLSIKFPVVSCPCAQFFLSSILHLVSTPKSKIDFQLIRLCFFYLCRGMKTRLAATYPDAFPDGVMSKTMDQRPDLESPLD